jgi:hypothetical protein
MDDPKRVDDLPYFISRKRVQAAKILDIIDSDDPIVLTIELPGGEQRNIATSMDFSRRAKAASRKPQVGDWFTIDRGFQWWTPAVEFAESCEAE